VVRARSLAELRDGLYLLAAALEDGERDLAGGATGGEVRAVYDELAAAAGQLAGVDLEVLALGDDADGP
jgi:hypothetical protein